MQLPEHAAASFAQFQRAWIDVLMPAGVFLVEIVRAPGYALPRLLGRDPPETSGFYPLPEVSTQRRHGVLWDVGVTGVGAGDIEPKYMTATSSATMHRQVVVQD